MAEKTLKTRILLRCADIDSWKASSTVLKKGEVAIVTVPSEDVSGASQHRPAVLMKVGDGVNTFNDLPWVQGIAADVYSWAKAATKPTYQASEIAGLSDFISGEIEDTNTTYRITKVSEYQYKLESKEVDGDWTQVSLIDLPNDTDEINALKALVGETPVATQITAAVAAIANSDAAVANQFVTAVKQANGVVTIERAALTEANIPNLSISKVTGLQGALNAKQDTLVFESPYDAETNKVATKADITAAVGGLSGAMHFRGVQAQLPADTTGYASGDVILVGNKEYVCDGTAWHELGDETIYAVKGSIVNADIAAGAAIDQSKIAGLTAALAGKVNTGDIGTMAAEDADDYILKTAAPGYDDILTQASAALSYETKTDAASKLSTAKAYTDSEIGALTLATVTAGTGNIISTISQTDGKVSATTRALTEADIPALAISKITNLQTTLDAKINSSAVSTIGKTGNINDVIQTSGDVLILNCGGAE